jgi:tetratricopeptide (TPR) repeat protein
MNFKVWIENLENDNLKRALRLRMERKFPEALEALNQACKEGDGKAWFFKARAYRMGGWTLLQDIKLFNMCIEEARKVNCPWTYQNGCGDAYGRGMWFKHSNRFGLAELKLVEAHALGNPLAILELFNIYKDPSILENVIAFGDEATQYVYFFKIGDTESRLKLAETKYQSALFDVANKMYMYMDYIKFAEYVTRNKIIMQFDEFVKHRSTSTQELQELFYYGRALKMVPNDFDQDNHKCYDRAKRVYKESSERAKAAVFCFVGLRLLTKDTRRLVGELVWRSRFDPAVWGVKL